MRLIQNYTHDEELTLSEFLYNFLTDLNKNNPTIDEKGNVVCKKNRARSLGAITSITKSYYPYTSMGKVKETLLDFGPKLVGHYCGDIEKRVYQHKDYMMHWGQQDEGDLDEYGDLITYKTN